jgi:hypothetical protein
MTTSNDASRIGLEGQQASRRKTNKYADELDEQVLEDLDEEIEAGLWSHRNGWLS